MKKYLLPSALILVFGLSVALAQNITKAIQLSQDATGAFGIDTSNNVYFPAHILNNGPGVPTVTATVGTAPSITSTSTDNQGVVTGNGNNIGSTIAITFSKAYLAAPACTVVSENPATSPLAYNVVPTGINISSTTTGSAIINYLCFGAK